LSTRERLDLVVERAGASLRLLSPGVGWFTAARDHGDLLAPGALAGVLLVLGRAFDLVVPASVEGRVLNPPSPRAHEPVGWGDVLYEIESVAGTDGARSSAVTSAPQPTRDAARAGDSGAFVVHSPQSGRFYLRPAPGEAPFAELGATVEQGQPIGLIEVMKTFAHVRYGGAGLPARARVTRVLVADGAEVGAGDTLIEVEPA
jgi:biotin carboxyl carrier protein